MKDILKAEVLESPYLVVLFDESLNKVTQSSEMDIMVRYWDVRAKRMEVRYWYSMFLGHTTHLDLLNRFFEGLEGLDATKLLQVSMDGPNTNLLFLKKLKKERIDNKLNGIIDIGSCSLHMVHGAYKTGAEKTDWNLHKVMKGSYFLLLHLLGGRIT